MPREAALLGAAAHVLALDDIGGFIATSFGRAKGRP
jgi:hypothetical protein